MEAKYNKVKDTLKLLKESKNRNVLLCMTGSVASIKGKEIVTKLLRELNTNVILVQTQSSMHFTHNCDAEWKIDLDRINEQLTQEKGEGAPFVVQFFDDEEYAGFKQRGDPVLHIELRNLASVIVVAPLSANTMGKMCSGICDNLVTCIFRCLPYKKIEGKYELQLPVVAAPSMNS